jgi:hypothetical protein
LEQSYGKSAGPGVLLEWVNSDRDHSEKRPEGEFLNDGTTSSGEGNASAEAWKTQLLKDVPAELCALLEQRDGAALVVPRLGTGVHPVSQENVWHACALFYTAQNRHYEALAIYYALYDKLIELQERDNTRLHKGTPLVRIYEAHSVLGHPWIAKRFLMLTMCEDAISLAGHIPAETSGTYFRMVWLHGISHEQLARYAAEVWQWFQRHDREGRFPEWILQQLDQEWMTEFASPKEARLYALNRVYGGWLLSQLGSGTGLELEILSHYLLSCVPGFRAYRRKRSQSSDYDVTCAVEGPALDFRADLGRYFLCECKDWEKTADVTAVVKFAAILRSAKCRFGILFAKAGISGEGETAYAERELLKILHQDDLTILVLTETDLQKIVGGANFVTWLRSKYEQIRLDLS